MAQELEIELPAEPKTFGLRDSRTSKESEIVEKALGNIFRRIFILISKEKQYPFELGPIKQRYEQTVYAAIRKAMQKQFLIAFGYVERSMGFETFISSKDEFDLSRATEEGVKRFWNKVDALANNQIEVMLAEDFGQEPPHLLNVKYILLLLSLSLSTNALGRATVSKSQQVLEANGLDPTRLRYMWVAQTDERTCLVLPNGQPGCRLLAGRIWEYWQGPEIPMPGGIGLSPTHFNCRCRVILLFDGKQKLL